MTLQEYIDGLCRGTRDYGGGDERPAIRKGQVSRATWDALCKLVPGSHSDKDEWSYIEFESREQMRDLLYRAIV